MNKKQKHGWVVRSEPTGYYQAHTDDDVLNGKSSHHYGNETLKSAHVYATRKLARRDKHDWERVYKVAICIHGRATTILFGR